MIIKFDYDIPYKSWRWNRSIKRMKLDNKIKSIWIRQSSSGFLHVKVDYKLTLAQRLSTNKRMLNLIVRSYYYDDAYRIRADLKRLGHGLKNKFDFLWDEKLKYKRLKKKLKWLKYGKVTPWRKIK